MKKIARTLKHGFTLIELSIVLVIIGLVTGSVLVGRDLIATAEIRSQISQIQQYQLAVNTFKVKYGYLPGDIPEPHASSLGLVARGQNTGQGDGNNLLDSHSLMPTISCRQAKFICATTGENATFWVDLSTTKLINNSFTTATPTLTPSSPTDGILGTDLKRYLPTGKINHKAFIYVWSGGAKLWWGAPIDAYNYFSLTGITASYLGAIDSIPILTVYQAYRIDSKLDDGLPQAGNIQAFDGSSINWAHGSIDYSDPSYPYADIGGAHNPLDGGEVRTGSGVSTPADDMTCYDNNNVTDAIEKYSIHHNSGRGVNCWLSFKML